MSARCSAAPPGVSQTTGAPAARTTAGELVRVDSSGAEVVVPVGAGVERVPAVVGVHQVDPAGDRLDPVDGRAEVDAAGPGVAGVEAEADVDTLGRQRVPEPAIASSWRAIAWSPPAVFSISTGSLMSVASNVLRQLSKPFAGSSSSLTWPPCTIRPLAPISAAASTCCWSSLRLRDPDPVVGRGHVDDVRRVDVEVDARRLGRRRAARRHRRRSAISGPL